MRDVAMAYLGDRKRSKPLGLTQGWRRHSIEHWCWSTFFGDRHSVISRNLSFFPLSFVQSYFQLNRPPTAMFCRSFLSRSWHLTMIRGVRNQLWLVQYVYHFNIFEYNTVLACIILCSVTNRLPRNFPLAGPFWAHLSTSKHGTYGGTALRQPCHEKKVPIFLAYIPTWNTSDTLSFRNDFESNLSHIISCQNKMIDSSWWWRGRFVANCSKSNCYTAPVER